MGAGLRGGRPRESRPRRRPARPAPRRARAAGFGGRGAGHAGGEALAPADLRFLARLPVTKRLTLGGASFLLVHGSPRDPLDDYAPADPAGWAERLKAETPGTRPDFVLAGHTHEPYVVRVADGPAVGAVVVNPGSAGQPRDGDPRASYALITDGVPTLHRAAYDPADAVAAVRACGWNADATDTAVRLLTRGEPGPSRAVPAKPAAAPRAVAAAVG